MGIDRYFAAVREEGLHPRIGNLNFYMRYLFDSIDLAGSNLLDIGGGVGLASFYAGASGAARVVCLEPEMDGSGADATGAFGRLAAGTGLRNVRLVQVPFQDFEPGSELFDVVLMDNSINHLDEAACMTLRHNPAARERYRRLFGKISRLARKDGILIITDCSRYNAFAMLGLRSPFARNIDWRKHQSPRTWAALLTEVGFSHPEIRWSSFNSLRRPGSLLLGNRPAAFFLTSHFRLTMRKE